MWTKAAGTVSSTHAWFTTETLLARKAAKNQLIIKSASIKKNWDLVSSKLGPGIFFLLSSESNMK